VCFRKYKSGAIGVLTHLATLQGTNYACELEVYCDGYLLKYAQLILRILNSDRNDVDI
jgi:hypothetical protein